MQQKHQEDPEPEDPTELLENATKSDIKMRAIIHKGPMIGLTSTLDESSACSGRTGKVPYACHYESYM